MMIEVHNNNKVVVVHVAASFLLLVVVVVVVVVVPWAAEAQFMPDFCTARSIMASSAAPFGGGGGGQRSSCPAPATANNLDLSTLLGSYYEIGSTARYKVKYELGMACSRTTFSAQSAAPSDDDGDGDGDGDGDIDGSGDADGGVPVGGGSSYSPLINVVSSGVPVVFGRQTLAAVGRIAAAASGVCSTAERLCAMSSPQSRITEALLRISAVMDQIPVPGADAAALAQASAVVNGSVAAIRGRLDRLARSVSAVAGMNAGLSQAAGGAVAADLLLRTLRASADVGMEVAREVGAFAINNLTFAANLLDAVATRNSIAAATATSSSSSSTAADNTQRLLQDASTLLQEELQLVSAQVTFIQGLLSSVGGPLADMVGAERRSADAAAAAAAGNTSRMILRSGQATQDPQERGSMILRSNTGSSAGTSSSSDFADTSTTTSSSSVSTPFRILALVPPGVGEYAAVLINTCDATFSGSAAAADGGATATATATPPPPLPQPELLLLSRTPTLTPQTVLNLLNAAASHGIFADCDSPFVPTLQRPDDCSFY